MVQNIHIQINRTRNYKVTVHNSLTNNVNVEEPYDILSNKFNRYTHKIQYKSGPAYDPSDYDLCLDDPNARHYYYIIFLYKPTKKIVSVDIFFLSDDTERLNPLIFGFNYESDPSVYSTYYHLRGIKYFYGTVESAGSFGKDDLISRLIDERGLYVTESHNKFVIRLGDKPDDTTPVVYPKGGNNSGKITLRKSELEEIQNYVKFEHDINKNSNVESFYIAFHQDTLYMIGDSQYGKLKSVVVYYNKHNGDVPVVVVFKFARRHKLYKFSDFYSDASKNTKRISLLENFGDVDLKDTLIDEYKRVKKEITFYKGRGDNKYISVTSDRYFIDNRDQFRRAILRPNLNTLKGGHPTGPYVLYNDNLFQKYSRTKIDEKILTDVLRHNFSAIYVYYNENNEPLLVGFIGDSKNKFFKIKKGGKSWEKDDDNTDIYHLGHLYSKLIQLENERKGLVSDVSVQRRPPSRPAGPKPGSAFPIPKQPEVQKTPAYKPPTQEYPKTARTDSLRPFKIDISITNKSAYDSGWVMVSEKQLYKDSNLFCYFTHTLKNNSEFTISSLGYGSSSSISINYFKIVIKVKFVSVYFNVNDLKKPVMLEFYQSNGKKRFFSNIINSKSIYSFSTPTEIQESNLFPELIRESDRINERKTFQIDKTTTYNDITVTSKPESGKSYTVYTHSVKGSSSKPSYILFNKNQLIVDQVISSTNIVVQDKTYDFIKTYALDSDKSFLLLIQFKVSNSITSLYRKDVVGTFKKLDVFESTDTTSVKNKLIEINYFLSKSVIVEINRTWISGISHEYEMNLIDNRPQQDKLTPAITEVGSIEKTKPLKKVKLLEETLSCSTEAKTSIKCYSHDISELVSAHQNRKISGIRLYLPKTFSRNSDMVELELFKKDSTDSQDRHYIYFIPSSANNKNRVYVYFFLEDPRPLLIKYDNSYFRPSKNNNLKWYIDSAIEQNDVCKLLTTLNQFHSARRNKLIFVQKGKTTNARVVRNTTLGKFRKDTFSADLENKDQQLFTLPKNIVIHEQSTDGTNLEILFDQLYTKAFDTVNVYMNQTGSSLKDIFLIEFINGSNKIHLKRRDALGNYWVEEFIQKNDDQGLQNELKSIETSFDDTIVYELDKTETDYSNRVSLYSETEYPTYGFNKYIHMASRGTPQKTLILFDGTKLVKKVGDSFVNLDDVEYKNFNKVTVFSIADTYEDKENFPLLIELNSGSSRGESNMYFYHRRKNSNYFWDKTDLSFSASNVQSLSEKLNVAKFELYDSIVLLMDKTMDKYGGPEIIGAINESSSPKDYNLAAVDTKNIKVNKVGSAKCLSKFGFRTYEHDLKTIYNNTNCGLRFYTLSNVSGKKYVELSLYNYNGDTREYLFYNSNNEKVFFYFYGDDPRPLLLFYGTRAYRATSMENYNQHKWFRDDRISDGLCKFRGDNQDLILSLSLVVGILNPVNIVRRPRNTREMEPNSPGYENEFYDAYDFNGDKLKFKVTYENRSCYRVYHHETNGFKGSGIGYRLGNIIYDNIGSDVAIKYNMSKPLISVSVFYNLFDFDHNYPVLVALRYYDDSYEYYELADKSSKFWNFIEEYLDESNVENKAYEILKKLEIDLDRKNEARTLFKKDECSEGSSNTTIVAAASGGGVTTAALVGGGITYAARPEWFIPVIRALV